MVLNGLETSDFFAFSYGRVLPTKPIVVIYFRTTHPTNSLQFEPCILQWKHLCACQIRSSVR
jgi:hypothetical protein